MTPKPSTTTPRHRRRRRKPKRTGLQGIANRLKERALEITTGRAS